MKMLRFWFLLCLLGKIGDMITTSYFVTKWGVNHEANPLVQYSIVSLGLPAAIVLNWLFFCACVSAFYYLRRKQALMLTSFLMIGVTFWNLAHIYAAS